MMNPAVVNEVTTREDASQFVIRYGIENDRYAQVFSSVSSCSVLLIGVASDELGKPSPEPSYSLIAAIQLKAPVDPDQTSATFEGNDFVLRLAKCGVPVRKAG
jgi:hypothetical protein